MADNTKGPMIADMSSRVVDTGSPPSGKDADVVDEALIERIWRDLDERATRERIRLVAEEIATRFHQATVKQFVPIFVHRQTVEQLRELLDEGKSEASVL